MRKAVTTVIVCICLGLASAARAGDAASEAAGTIARARRLVDAKDYASATTLLEDLLLEAPARERSAVLGILRQCYEVMAREAESAGRDREAAHYRDNLAILGADQPAREPARPANPRTKRTPGPESPPVTIDQAAQKSKGRPRPVDPKILIPAPKSESAARALEEPAALPEPAEMARPEPASSRPAEPQAKGGPAPSSQFSQQPPVTPRTDDPGVDPAGAEKPPAGPTLEDADRLFSAKQYNEAERCYGALARQKRLPAQRTNHWAYCRIVRVAQRMNARPRTSREWDEIEAEIQSIQRLAPNLWYGEYLRNRLAEVRKGRSRTQPQNNNLVVRGSAPDESQERARRFPQLVGKSRAATPSTADENAPPAAPAPQSAPERAQEPVKRAGNRSQPQPSFAANAEGNGSDAPAAAAASPPGSASEIDGTPPHAAASTPAAAAAAWQVRETPNFRIFHTDARLAELAADAAESVRAAQAKKWASSALQKPWVPRCEIYLHPTGKAFTEATGQPETSPGFSTLESNGNQITTRRVLLRADHPQLLAAILPHEVTHVVVADLFTVQQIPRWADEGIAVLAEPTTEQNLRASDLQESLAAGQIFELSKLMSIDAPDARDWSLYYAQSVSLTRFLVEQGTPEQLIQFVLESGRNGIEAALRDIYRIAGFADLQVRWQAYARQQVATIKSGSPTTSATD